MGPAASQTQNYDLSDASDRGLRRMVTIVLCVEIFSASNGRELSGGQLNFERHRSAIAIGRIDVRECVLPLVTLCIALRSDASRCYIRVQFQYLADHGL